VFAQVKINDSQVELEPRPLFSEVGQVAANPGNLAMTGFDELF
jgi:hypothetical protein